MPKASSTEIIIPELTSKLVEVTVKGITPLLCNRFSEASAAKLVGAQGDAPKLKKEARRPADEFEGSIYRLDGGGYGFPAIAFKRAMVTAAKRFTDEAGTRIEGIVTVPGDLLEVRSPSGPIQRMDRVVHGGMTKVTNVAYRSQFTDWEVTVPIVFLDRFLSLSQVLNLVKTAGITVGIGAWRVEKKGSFGQFGIVEAREIVS